MYSLQLSCPHQKAEAVADELWDWDAIAISESELGNRMMLLAGFETDEKRNELLSRFAAYEPEWQRDDTDWELETRKAWPPREVGQRIFLAPTWCGEETPEDRIRLIHNPGSASGTGEHPCTQLALQSLESCVTPASRMVDVGTGSGILAIAAILLGAASSVAIDSDEGCLSTARENFALNGLKPWLVAGSAGCLSENYSDLTVANISGTVLVSMMDKLLSITKRSGTLVLTGFTEGEAGTFQTMFPGSIVSECNEWRCLIISLSLHA